MLFWLTILAIFAWLWLSVPILTSFFVRVFGMQFSLSCLPFPTRSLDQNPHPDWHLHLGLTTQSLGSGHAFTHSPYCVLPLCAGTGRVLSYALGNTAVSKVSIRCVQGWKHLVFALPNTVALATGSVWAPDMRQDLTELCRTCKILQWDVKS